MKNKIAKWYMFGLWTADMVWNAVKKDILTEAEATAILTQEE